MSNKQPNKPQPKKTNRGRKPGRVPTRPLMLRLPLPLAEQLDARVEQTRRAKNAEIVLALEAWLQAHPQ